MGKGIVLDGQIYHYRNKNGLECDKLYYKGIGADEEDDDWQPFDVMDTMVACTIDSVHDAVYKRVDKK